MLICSDISWSLFHVDILLSGPMNVGYIREWSCRYGSNYPAIALNYHNLTQFEVRAKAKARHKRKGAGVFVLVVVTVRQVYVCVCRCPLIIYRETITHNMVDMKTDNEGIEEGKQNLLRMPLAVVTVWFAINKC